MSLPGWSMPGSPFHGGEHRLQQDAGFRERIEQVGRRVVRNVMPEEHRCFFAGLSYLVVGVLDARRRPWASIVTGAPGFVTAPDATTLRIAARFRPDEPIAGVSRPAPTSPSSASISRRAAATAPTATDRPRCRYGLAAAQPVPSTARAIASASA